MMDDWKDDKNYAEREDFYQRVLRYRNQIVDEPLSIFTVGDMTILFRLHHRPSAITEDQFNQLLKKVPERSLVTK